MRLKALVVAASLMAYVAPVMAQGVEVRDHGKKRGKGKGHVEVRGEAPEAKVTGFAPATGPVGTVVTISGSGFLPQTKVKVGGRPVKEISSTGNVITFAIPERYFDGTITLHHPGSGNEIPVGRFAVQVDPKIASFQPTAGPVGTRVELAGEGFLNGDQVLFNGRPLPLAEFGPNRIVVVIPQGATSDEFTITRPSNNYKWSSRQKFQVQQPAPMVSSISPTTGAPGTQVRISGNYFAAEDRVYYGPNQPVNIVGRADTWLDVQVPGNARQSNPFTIKGSRGMVQTPVFVLVVAPNIARFAPEYGGTGTRVDIYGANFAQGDQVYLNGKPLKRLGYDERKLTVEIPAGATTDKFVIFRDGKPAETANKPFEVINAPTVSGFTPANGPGGTRVRINGTGFGPDAKVTYGAQPLTVVVRGGDTVIDVVVPKGAQNQPFTVIARGGSVSSATAFQVTEYSRVMSISPDRGPVGTRVTINEINYTGLDAFYLGNLSLPIVERSPGKYVVQIPPGAKTGNIDWESYGRRQTFGHLFVVTESMSVASVDPLIGKPGSKVSIKGEGFTPQTKVYLGNRPCNVVSRLKSTVITCSLPADAPIGKDYIKLEDSGVTVNAPQPFEVVGAITATGFSPASGPVGTRVNVSGSNFGGSTSVMLGDRTLPLVSRTATSIQVSIPAGAKTDYIYVVDGNDKIRLTQFQVIGGTPPPPPPPPPGNPPPPPPPAAACTFTASPVTAAPGGSVTIDTSNCNVKNVKKAWFKGADAQVQSVSPTSVVVKLPANANGTDAITLETDDGRGVAVRARTSNKITVRAGY